ncbi:MAG: hypothetical protein IJB97_04215 [Clostridia bacterium]|nr:hypothetical protein [Clostridia bacterium]
MKHDLSFWQLFGLTFAAVFGTLFHFLYVWTGFLPLAAVCAVNESTFEHVKILFFPMLAFAVLQFFFFRKEFSNFWRVKLSGILLATALIPVLFYTYAGAFGAPPAWLNVLFFYAAAGAGYYREFTQFRLTQLGCHQFENGFFGKINARTANILAFVFLCLLAVFFVVCTFFPPRLPLFQDPITGSYGLQ